MIEATTVKRFVSKCAQQQPYRFLDSLVGDSPHLPLCRTHGVAKTHHVYGAQLWVCPECFPAEVGV